MQARRQLVVRFEFSQPTVEAVALFEVDAVLVMARQFGGIGAAIGGQVVEGFARERANRGVRPGRHVRRGMEPLSRRD